ncbi:Ribosomal RNA large subunit methyltransferase H [Mesomycoplasma dispar]|uniref:Ribosomal RNA large subunit methyltransferase H n=1 Tax=Mesomycoplasma dispar TaxID=86660 RepID=A0AAJ5TCC0_9BACT|nr:23S rRNA (pseudouridine(1915)-N(3))-methyltransferase RlmH [Mesomycoplasma dispar]AJR11888.1 50S rRNA methyltransferase [Mesomycoplasma dispar]ATP59365.1 50S rRNA methyltransferase [Mesomycoplasma dispar]VEU61154.1 Ribosomal RNA large subunit methyltransferase H [Mesomycoplasma dispar]
MKILIINFASNSRDFLPLYQKEVNKIKEFKYQIEFVNLSEQSVENIDLKKSLETKVILQKIPKNYTCYLFTERGKMVSSQEFSQLLNSANICFIIGGSQGVDEKLLSKTMPNIRFLSFGKITFPHRIFKLVLLEQIYRGFSIKHNRKYHHGE